MTFADLPEGFHDSKRERDANTIGLGAKAPEARVDLDGCEVIITRSAGTDNAFVVFIDTDFEPGASDGGPGLRVRVNDHPVYVGVAYEPREEDI